MAESLEVPFAKFHGLGNDFIVAEGGDLPPALSELAVSICRRHTGIGADGFLVVLPPEELGHDALVRFFNADGSEAEMSGNGIRCVGALLVGSRRTKKVLEIETDAGLKTLETVHEEVGKWTIRVNMGEPILDPEEIPFEAGNFPSPIRAFPLRTEEGLQQVTVTSMGNPHCTIFVSDFDALDWPGVGQEIEDHELFPNRTNVEFVRVVSRNEVEVRFWERGVGHTMSSGTGSCAAVVASILNGLTNREVHVQTEAGSLEVTWPEGREVCLTGPVEKIAQGTYYYQE